MPQLLARHPKLRVQVVVSNRRVDLIEQRIDVAVRLKEVLDADGDLQMKVVSRAPGILVASPVLVAERGPPQSPADLANYPVVSLIDEPGPDRWILRNDSETAEVVLEPRLSSSSPSIVRDAVADGVGLSVMPEWACRKLLDSGRLVQVLPGWTRNHGVIHMVFTSRRGLLPGVRAVLDFLAVALSPKAAWDTAL